MSWLLTPAAFSAGLALLALSLLARAVVVGRPDEWILLIRDGRCVRAGVGIVVFRRPFDTVARFSATVQRVAFTARALTRDRVEAEIEGYAIWSIDPRESSPFVAFHRLGLGGQATTGARAQAPRHVLSKPQYRAFQTAIGAAAQIRATAHSLDELALAPAAFIAQLHGACEQTLSGLGVRVDEVQVIRVRAADPQMQEDLTAASSQRMHEEAETARLGTAQRLRQLRADAETAAAARETESLRARESDRIAAELALEDERRRLDAIRQARQDAELAARLAREHREAEAEAARIRLLVAAEEEKSQALRDYELARLRTERMADAFGSLPVKDARWFTLGSPLDSLSKLLDSVN